METKTQGIKSRPRKVYERDYDVKDLEYVLSNHGKKTLPELAKERGLALSQVTNIVQGLRRQGFDLDIKPSHKTLFKVFAAQKIRRASKRK